MATLEVEKLSKKYAIGAVRRLPTLRERLAGALHPRRRREKPVEIWAVREVSFSLEHGEIVGLIGSNGAGKSTLLKMLSRITYPTEGRFVARGRLASLLEVGTGFHPELTGRENVYLNGTILGMKRQEVRAKFDEIVEFSGVAAFIDTPVKHYSSGMYLRLAFAVAAHLEPEILVLDEVLAVGDAEFQRKCLGKMGDVARQGRTVLFVSHNLAAVKNLCTRALLLQAGRVVHDGSAETAIGLYLQTAAASSDLENAPRVTGNARVRFSQFGVSQGGEPRTVVLSGQALTFVFRLKVNDPTAQAIDVGFSIHDDFGATLAILYSGYSHTYFTPDGPGGYLSVSCEVTNFYFAPGRYYVKGLIRADREIADWPEAFLGTLDVELGDFYGSGHHPRDGAPYLLEGRWQGP